MTTAPAHLAMIDRLRILPARPREDAKRSLACTCPCPPYRFIWRFKAPPPPCLRPRPRPLFARLIECAARGVRHLLRRAADTVTGFDWETNTRMNFTTSRGDIVQLHDGRAYLHKFHRNVDADFEYRRFHLCESNVKCSAIESVLSDDIAVEEMLNRSIEAAAEAAEAADVELMRKHEDAPLHSVRPLTDREQEFVDACPGFSHEYLVDTVDGFSELWEHASLYEQVTALPPKPCRRDEHTIGDSPALLPRPLGAHRSWTRSLMIAA